MEWFSEAAKISNGTMLVVSLCTGWYIGTGVGKILAWLWIEFIELR